MSDVFITMITVVLALILMFIFPLAFIGNQNEIITGDEIKILADDFVNKVAREGKIIDSDYYEFLQKLNATGNTYNVSLEVQILDNSNLTEKNDIYVIGENMYYSEFTTAIEDTLAVDGEYGLKQGDYVKVKIENTNITFGTQIKRLMYGILGRDVVSLDTNSSAIVMEPSLDASEIAKGPIQTIDLANLNWKKDYYWINDATEPWKDDYSDDKTSHPGGGNPGVWDGSISRIHIDETESGANIVEMIGNSRYEGKGATWATIDGDKIKQISFSYDLNEGDSFYDAGILLNIDSTIDPKTGREKTLFGYMISFNFRDNYENSISDKGGILSRAGYPKGPDGKYTEDQTGAIIKFRYEVGTYNGQPELNKELMRGDELQVLTTFNASREAGTGNTDRLRLRRYKGKIKIKVTDEGYNIRISNGSGTFEYNLKVNQSEMKANTIGFFSEHHEHGCWMLGHFKLYNVKVIGNILGNDTESGT